jgi:integrase/recombinase XerD
MHVWGSVKMAYNKDRRRGITTKHQKRKKLVHSPKDNPSPIANNGIYPYLLAFSEWGGVKGLSKNTIKQREVGLQRWILWCDDRGLDDPKAITKPILERYQKYLYHYRRESGEPLSVRYQASLLLPIKTFFKWLAQGNRILYNPASELEMPKMPMRLPQAVLSVEEVERVVCIAKTDTVYGIRDRAILETLYSTGIRRTECANLTLYDIDSHRQTVMIRQGKGGKDRLLPIGKRALHWLDRYRYEVRDQLVIDRDDTHLFLTDYGEPFINGRLGALVKRYFHHAEIDKPGGCHLFRHAMATHMLDNGADLRFIQMMLGHSQLSTTEIYTHVSIEKLREIHTATHPAKLDPL